MSDPKADKKPAAGPLTVKVKNAKGSDAGQVQVDAAKLGGMVRTRLMHSASVMYHANTRMGTHCTKTRAEVAGSNKKLYRQKGTGRARAGSKKSNVRKHGGIAHGPKPRKYGFDMPKKQRRAAVKSAVLAKLKDGEVTIVDNLGLTGVKTKTVRTMLQSLGIMDKKSNKLSVLILSAAVDHDLHLSCRNLTGCSVKPVDEMNARDVLTHKNVVFTKASFDRFQTLAARAYEKRVRKIKGTRKTKSAAAAPAAAAKA